MRREDVDRHCTGRCVDFVLVDRRRRWRNLVGISIDDVDGRFVISVCGGGNEVGRDRVVQRRRGESRRRGLGDGGAGDTG